MTRRRLLALLASLPAGLRAQMASRGVKALPRGAPSGRPFHARFTDVASQAGLRAPTIYGAEGGSDYIVETIGCGAVFFDYDNDGWLDIFLPCGSRFHDAPKDATNRLYKNNRDGTFTDVTEKAGLVRSGWASGATVGDYNNDGFEDLFLTYWGQNVLYRNNGDGTFTDVTQQAGLLNRDARWGSGCTFVDYDRDGRLDLFVANYLQFDPKTTPRKGQDKACNWKGVAVNCGPRGLLPETHLLYHNNGDGTFSDVSVQSGIAKAKGSYGLTAVAADFDNDGWPDIFVACDSTPSLLFRNNHDGTFTEDGMSRGVALNDDGAEQAGMGVAVGDVSLKGSLDILTTHFADDTSTLSINDGKGNFGDETLRAGLGVETRFVSWGCGMPDLDNDGYPDLFAVTGSVYPEMERAIPELAYKTPRVLFRNLGNGKFEELMDEAGPGVTAAHSSRGCAFGDFDNDGDLDILINNINEPPSLLRNDVSPSNHWLKVKLIGVVSNRSAIGGRVTARYGGKVQAQEVLSQSSFFSVSDSRLHFGLGAAQFADLEIRWPNGRKEMVAKVPANRLVVIKEGAGIIDSPLAAAFQKPVA